MSSTLPEGDSIYNLRFKVTLNNEDKYYDMTVNSENLSRNNILAKFNFNETTDPTGAQESYTLKDNTGIDRQMYLVLDTINGVLTPKLEVK